MKKGSGKYTVYVDDNFHFMDESERYEHGSYRTLAAAVKAAKRIVDEYLEEHYKPGMTAEELYSAYTSFGEDPWISPDEDNSFSAWDYAKERCREICGSGRKRAKKDKKD